MMKRRILLWMGLIVLFLSFGICRETLATETYKAKRGDSIAAIAKKHGVDPGALKEMNNLRSNFLKAGQEIILAKADGGQKKSAPSADASIEVDEYEEEDGGRTGDPRGDINLTETEKDAQSNAELLGKWNNPEERKLFVKVATAFLGAPYRLGGASLRGIDCSAFVKKKYQLFDVSLPRTAKEQAHVGVRVAKDDLIEGDLVFFNTKRSFGHVGIYIGNNEFVHASSRNKGIRIDKLDQPYFNKRFVKAIRLKGLDEEGAILGIADNVKRFN